MTGGARHAARRGNAIAALLLLAPALLAVVVLRLWPAGLSLVSSFEAPGVAGVSLENYRHLFADPDFRDSIATTLRFVLIVNPLQVTVALALALLMNAAVPLVGLWRTLVFLPIAIPPSVSAVVWGVGYRPDGPINAVLEAIGLGAQRFLTSPEQALLSVVAIVSWVGIGYWMTFLLAGLQDIPRTLYEAARIDGATRWQQFRYVTLPQLRRPLTFVVVANTVANFLVFAPVQILTQGGPAGTTNLIMHEIYSRAFNTGDTSGAHAATVILVALVLLVVTVQFRLMRREADA